MPIMTSGIECGGWASVGQPLRLPSTSTAASAAMPALTWIAVPPAKSSEPRWPSQPPNTHLKIGTYTMNSHSGTKIAHAENFMRSATAPEISAGVIAANIPRKATIASAPPSPATVMSFSMNASKTPMKSLSNGTWASE